MDRSYIDSNTVQSYVHCHVKPAVWLGVRVFSLSLSLYIYICGIPRQIGKAETLTILLLLFFYSNMLYYKWPQKNDLHHFSDFFEHFSGSNDRNC